MGYYICGIYEKRPEMCKKYPERDSYIPESCTYYFADGQRKGFCDPECEGACCRLPRHHGEPTAPGLPEIAGGLPCKYLIYSETHPGIEKRSSAEPEEDRADNRPALNPLEQFLEEINGS